MRKSTRIVKKYISVFLIVLMSINTFGAVVSDNDGSAFITKAEFDSLKNNFQSQIDQYNTSIDSKIDGAIAAYLAGVQVAKRQSIKLNLEKITDKTIFWTSATDFAYHPNRPLFSEYFLWGEYYLTTAFSLEYNRPSDSFSIESGTIKDGYFRVAECANWHDKFTDKCEYFFGGQNDQGYIGGRSPSLSGWIATRTISLSEQSGWGHTLWACNYPTRDRALAENATDGWRYSTSYVSLSTLKSSVPELILAPFSTAKTYVRDTGNENNQKETITGDSTQTLGFVGDYWSDVTDMRKGSLQSVDPTTLDRTSKTNLWPNINGSSVRIPWLTKTYQVNQLKFEPLISASGYDEPIVNGVCLYVAESTGTFELSFTATDDGYGLFYIGPNAISIWGSPTSRVVGVNYVECTANHKTLFSVSAQKNDFLLFIYYPTDPSARAKVTFDTAYFIAD